MPARLRTLSPGATLGPPIQVAMTGLPPSLAKFSNSPRPRSADRSCPAARARPANRRRWGRRRPRDGLVVLFGAARRPGYRQGCRGSSGEGETRSARSSFFRASWASLPPQASRASVASTPGPPALVTMARRGPFGRGCLPRASEAWKSSAMVFTRSTPQRRNAASSTSSLPVSEPVWEAAALAAASVRPGLMTMIGFERATSRAAERNDLASPTDSI